MSAFLKNMVLLFLTLVASIVCADFSARLILNIPSNYLPKLVYFNPQLQPAKRLRPDLNLKVTSDLREFTFHVSTDHRGFRKSWNQPGDARPIVFLGDSQTFGIGAQDDETFVYRFGEIMGTSTVNTGVPGYNNIEQLLLLRSDWTKLNPKTVVLCFFTGNDAFENSKSTALAEGLQTAPIQQKITVTAKIKNFLVKKSALYQLVIRLRRYPFINIFLKQFGLVENQTPGELVIFSKATDSLRGQFWTVTDDVISQINDEVKKKSSELIVLLIPDRYQVDALYWDAWVSKYHLRREDYDLSSPNRHIKDFCKKNKIPFIDPTPALLESQQRAEDPYWKIDNHLSPRGHQIISTVLSEYFKRDLPK